MQTININPVSSELDDSKPKLILLKGIAIATLTVSFIGGIIHVVSRGQSITKAPNSEQVKPGNGRRELTIPTQPSEQSQIIVKKPQKPIVIEEGAEAWFCLKNNGGDGCLSRDRFAPNYRVIAPLDLRKLMKTILFNMGLGVKTVGGISMDVQTAFRVLLGGSVNLTQT